MRKRKRLQIHSGQLAEWVSQLNLAKHAVTAQLWEARAAVKGSAIPDGMELFVEPAASNLPAISLSGREVFGQVQASAGGNFVAKVGFTEQDTQRLAALLNAAANSKAAEEKEPQSAAEDAA